MPQSLSRRTALILVAVAFGLTLGVGVLLAGGSPAEAPPPKLSAQSMGADAPAAEPDLRLVAAGTVPALREPRRPRARKPARKPEPAVREVTRVVPTVRPAPVQPAAPVPTPAATPRYIPPTPPPSAPKPKPKPKPSPAAGEFDTSGEES